MEIILVFIIGVLILIAALGWCQSFYYQGKWEESQEHDDTSGWQDEAEFWRRCHNKEATMMLDPLLPHPDNFIK